MLLFLLLPLLSPGDAAARAVLPARSWFRAAGQVPLWRAEPDAPTHKSAAGPADDDLADWIAREEAIALERLLANAAPGGRHGAALPAGAIVQSPARDLSDYYYQC